MQAGVAEASERVLLIGVHQGFSVRYLLQTEVLPRLAGGADKVVIVAPEEGDYLDEFRRTPGVEVEVVPRGAPRRYCDSSLLQKLFRQVRLYSYGRRVATGEILWRFYCGDALAGSRDSWWKRLLTAFTLVTIRILIALMRGSRLFRRSLLWVENRLFSPRFYDKVLDDHRPDLVVVSSLGTFDYDQYLMRAARRKGIPVAAVTLSWDNTTTRGYPGARADHAVAWTELMKKELAELHDFDERRVFVGGVAHFDGYYREDPEYDRDSFLRELGADPGKRVLFVATRSPNSYPWNPNIAEILAEAVRDGRLPDCQVVVRIHPLHYRLKPGGGYVFQDVLDAYDAVAREYPGEVVLNVPRFASDRIDYAMPRDEIRTLTCLLKAADVIVTIFSTINLEGAIMDKPLVNVCFENLEHRYDVRDKARFNIVADSELTHNKRVTDTGGVAVARTPEQLVEQAQAYLSDPSLHREGRARIVENEAGPNRGTAGRAIADHLLSIAKEAGA